jgi:hypothetical protein
MYDFGGNSRRKGPIRKPSCRFSDNRGIRKWGMGWIDLTQDRYKWKTFVNTLPNLSVS